MQFGESFDVQFIDDAVAPGHGRRAILAPIEPASLDHARLVHVRRAVGGVDLLRQHVGDMAEQRGIPFELARQRFRVGIEQQLVGVVTQAV
jgi:hypothetical protein